VGPVQGVTMDHPVYKQYRERIERLTRRIANIQEAIGRAEASELKQRHQSMQNTAAFLRVQLKALTAARRQCSHELLEIVQESYTISNQRGESLPLASVWANTADEPKARREAKGQVSSSSPVTRATASGNASLFTAGAGDCAAPKLLEAAVRQGLRPVSLAEVWFGAPLVRRAVTSKHSKLMARLGRASALPPVMTPVMVTRAQGRFYPCCDKCSRILGWQLCGYARPW